MKIVLVREVVDCSYDGKSVVSLEEASGEFTWDKETPKLSAYSFAGSWKVLRMEPSAATEGESNG